MTEGSVTTRHDMTAQHRHNGGINNPGKNTNISAQNSHPCVRPSPRGCLGLIHNYLPCCGRFTFLPTAQVKGTQYSPILHALYLSLSLSSWPRILSARYSIFKKYSTPSAYHQIHSSFSCGLSIVVTIFLFKKV